MAWWLIAVSAVYLLKYLEMNSNLQLNFQKCWGTVICKMECNNLQII